MAAESPKKQTQYGPNQTRSEFIPKGAEIPTGELLGILKPGTNPPHAVNFEPLLFEWI